MKTYYIMVSVVFPQTHPRKGEPTSFISRISNGQKIHTIRANYALWKKRIDEVNQGDAILELRFWEGRPYKSHQQTFKVFKQGEVCVQKLQQRNAKLIDSRNYFIDDEIKPNLTTETLAKNDGLGLFDFINWFKSGFGVEQKAIIHFTKFRY